MNDTVFNSILSLSDLSFGKNYLTARQLTVYLEDTNTLVLFRIKNNHLQGFSIVHILNIEQLKEALFVSNEWVKETFGQYKTIGYRRMTAVAPEYIGNGIASKLFNEGRNWFEQKTEVIVSAAWTKNGVVSFGPILQKNGFEAIKPIEDYWKDDSLKRSYSCPVCGAPPCECDAVIYKKEIK